MHVVVTRDASEFAERAGCFLQARIERNILSTVLNDVLSAATSRRALARGARTCILYTDLLNPTSNKIYAEVGYRRVADWEELAFERAESAGRDSASLNGAPAVRI
jgi:hypothetical protein